jgi:hypothetical protein
VDEPGSKPPEAPKRDEKGRLLPGSSGNPGGRSKIVREFKEWLLAEAYPKAQQALLELLSSDDDKVRIQAVKEVNDRLFGRAPVTVEDVEGNRLGLGLVFIPSPEEDDAGSDG